ncbi:MAG: electron transfer flavoprotein subunit beta/FixA family protein [Elusimicrobia bacterium]|nr:electron transfer flavoprotein subunit beta/FixA family protein [Elusimicrobiota bacterium]
MKILVCIKQIPDMASKFKPNAAGSWFSEADLAFRMNEYDEYAVEEAVKLREKDPASELAVLSVGPARVVEALKKALAMGCDRAVHVPDEEAYRKDPWQIASIIAGYAKKGNFDIIFTGMQSQDRGSAQIGPLLAGMLGFSCVTTAIGFSLEGRTATAKRELEGGAKGVVKAALPAVITCQLGLNTPRYPTLPNIMKAKKKEIAVLNAAELSSEAALAGTEKFYAPVKKGTGLVLEGGDAAALAGKLIDVLKEKTTVLRG